MATQAEIDAAKGTVDKLTQDAEERAEKVEGATVGSQLDAERKIEGKVMEYCLSKTQLKIEGGFTRIQVGASQTIINGVKGEYIAPISMALIAIADVKTVVGLSKTTILGAKMDSIVGAKIDNLLGLKHEVTVSETEKIGGSPAMKKEGSCSDKIDQWMMKIGNWTGNIVNNLYKVDEVKAKSGKVKKDIANLTEKIKELKALGATYTAKVDSIKQECSSAASFDATKLEFDCGGWQARGSGGFLNLFPDSQCYMEAGGSDLICGPSAVKIVGPTHFLGKSF
jgi:hypothetical protein